MSLTSANSAKTFRGKLKCYEKTTQGAQELAHNSAKRVHPTKMWTVPKYHSTNIYTRNYLSHRTVQYGAHSFTGFSESGATSRVAHSFSSDKLYICLSNKCFNCIQRIRCATYVRPSQDHRILRICNRQINLADACQKGTIVSKTSRVWHVLSTTYFFK